MGTELAFTYFISFVFRVDNADVFTNTVLEQSTPIRCQDDIAAVEESLRHEHGCRNAVLLGLTELRG